MKRLLLGAIAACAMAVLPSLSASAMPITSPAAIVSGSDGDVIQVRHGGGHRMMRRGGRGHHHGWARGGHRGHHYGWSRGRHRGHR